jgi:hypothetical protein
MALSATKSPLPDNLLLPGKSLGVVNVAIPVQAIAKRDVLIFIDSTKSAQHYLPVVKPLIAEFVRKITPTSAMVDAFSLNTGVKNLLFNGDADHDGKMIDEMMYPESTDELNPTEMFFTASRFLEAKMEYSATSRTTLVLFAFASSLMANPDFQRQSAEFNKLSQYLPVDVHVVSYGGFTKPTFFNMVSGLGSLTGSYQACVTDLETERLAREEPDTLAEHADDIRRDTNSSIETLCRYLQYSDALYKVGLYSSRMLNMSCCRDVAGNVTGRIVLPNSVSATVEHHSTSSEVELKSAELAVADLKYALVMSIRGVLANFDRYGTEKKLEALFKTLIANKGKGGFYTALNAELARDGSLQTALQSLSTLLIEQVSGEGANSRAFAQLATRCSRMLAML